MDDHQCSYRQIVESVSDAVVFVDRQGVIRLWNARAEAVFGYSAEEAIGQTLDIIIPENLRQRHWEAFHKAMSTGTTKYGAGDLLAVPAMRKDGTRISLEFTIAILRDEAGEVLGPVAVMRDVTERWQRDRELRQRLTQLEAEVQELRGS